MLHCSDVALVFQRVIGSVKGVLYRVLQRCYKGVNVCYIGDTENVQGCCRGVMVVSQRCYKGVTKVLQRCLFYGGEILNIFSIYTTLF